MKLCRYNHGGSPAIGVVHDGRVYNTGELFEQAGQQVPEVLVRGDMRAICAAPEVITQSVFGFLADASGDGGTAVEDTEFLAPIPDPSKIICIGLNYLDHCEEQNKPRPERPMLFAKFANTIAGPTDSVEIPANTHELDFEGELAVVIGRLARNVSRAEAMSCVFGYMALQDVSARDLQRTDGQWVRAKSQDGFAPCGPWIVTADEISDPHNLKLQTDVNGVRMQDSNTGNMIFRIDELIEFVTASMTLLPGDIISTGTPAGVGVHRNPQVLLKKDDLVEVTIEGIGRLQNRFV